MPTYRHSYVFADGVPAEPVGLTVIQKPLITANGNYPSDMGIAFQGGSAQLAIGGALGGGTYQLQQRLLDGQTWVNVPGASLTSAGVAAFAAPEAVRLRLNVSGASSPNAMAYALDLPEGTSFAPVAGSGGGGGGGVASQVEGTKAAGEALATMPNPLANGLLVQDTAAIMTADTMQFARADRYGNLRIAPMLSSSAAGDSIGNSSFVHMGVRSSAQGTLASPMVAGMVLNPTGSFDRQRGDTNGTYSVQSSSDSAAVATVPVVTTVASATLIAKAAAGNVYSIGCTTGATAGYLMLFDATTAPADGTVTPKETIPIAANTAIKLDYVNPARMTSGITLVFSSTGPFTKTASATAFLKAMVR